MDCAVETVFATPELYTLIAEHVFDPEHSLTQAQLSLTQARLDYSLPTAWRHDLATLASLARVNRALARMPWPASAGTAHLALGHAAESAKRQPLAHHAAPDADMNSPAALAARAADKATLELGLAAVARACIALVRELAADAAGLQPHDGGGSARAPAPAAARARAPSSTAERAYRACLLYSEADGLIDAQWWRYTAHSLLPKPPPRLALALFMVGTSACLPAELRAAALSTLGAVAARLENFVVAEKSARQPHRRAQRPLEPAPPPASPAEQEHLLASAELGAVHRMLEGAIDRATRPDSTLAVGALGLALKAVFSVDDGYYGYAVNGSGQPWDLFYLPLLPSLCALFADPRAPVGARARAAAAMAWFAKELANGVSIGLETEGRHVDMALCDHANCFLYNFDTSGASESCLALGADASGALSGSEAARGRELRSPPTVVMAVSRAHLLSEARSLQAGVDFLKRSVDAFIHTMYEIDYDDDEGDYNY